MKYQIVKTQSLKTEGRWDIDYHLPSEGITEYQPSLLKPISAVADIVKDKRNPTFTPDDPFKYVDISCIDINSGLILTPQELIGSEAPSRARKVINAYDLIISTVRPTRGAIAIITEGLHNQICSTGFSVIRPKKGINPFYLHFAIRLSSTLEQFRKFSTGSSYPAILDSDVEKTLIPIPNKNTQDLIASHILEGLTTRKQIIDNANQNFNNKINLAMNSLITNNYNDLHADFNEYLYKANEIAKRLKILNDYKGDRLL